MTHGMPILRVRGVALIVSNPRREVLIIQELQTKPHLGKYAGMFSPPMETSHKGEPDHSVIARLIDEELPGLANFITVESERRGVYRIVPRVWVSLYAGHIQDSLLPTPDERSEEEIGGYTWMLPKDAITLWLRQGAREMLSDYIKNKSGAVCRHCCPPAPLETSVPL